MKYTLFILLFISFRCLSDTLITSSGLKYIIIYEGNGIKVIRVGLQPTDNINEGLDVAAGPFHPAFRQLVESRRMLNRMERNIIADKLQDCSRMIIYTKEKHFSDVIGQKRNNIDYLKTKYNIGRIDVKSLESASDDMFRLEKKS
ncbi:MAG: hypothetical protein N2510_01610 [Ignavibacteria bacterium]|nr:hypothetical protein [Ignavibacteria bacterium]